MKKLMKCLKCGKYTMKERCCGERTIRAGPAKWSVEDKYGKYRRMIKKKKEG